MIHTVKKSRRTLFIYFMGFPVLDCVVTRLNCIHGWIILSSLQPAYAVIFTVFTRHRINSLAPEKFEWNFRHVIFIQILVIVGWSISCEIALIWMSLDFTDGQSTLFQVTAWCHQATSHCLSQCWHRSLLPCDITRPQWFNNALSVSTSI